MSSQLVLNYLTLFMLLTFADGACGAVYQVADVRGKLEIIIDPAADPETRRGAMIALENKELQNIAVAIKGELINIGALSDCTSSTSSVLPPAVVDLILPCSTCRHLAACTPNTRQNHRTKPECCHLFSISVDSHDPCCCATRCEDGGGCYCL